jgi:hypothetical protein
MTAMNNKTQKAGGSCGTANNKMKGGSAKKSQNGGGSCGTTNNKMKGGNNFYLNNPNRLMVDGGRDVIRRAAKRKK